MDTEDKQSINKNIKKKDNQQAHEENLNNISTHQHINNNELIELEKKILNNQKKIHDMQLRHLAYIENIKKDAEIEIKNIKKIKKEEFFKKIIPIIAVLEDTLSFSKKSQLYKESLVQGIELILESLLKTIYKFGVKIEGKKNESFNPKIHKIILTENSTEVQPGHIISIERKGFSFNDIVLRKAHIIISKM